MDNSIKKTATKEYLVTALYLLERIKLSNACFHKFTDDIKNIPKKVKTHINARMKLIISIFFLLACLRLTIFYFSTCSALCQIQKIQL